MKGAIGAGSLTRSFFYLSQCVLVVGWLKGVISVVGRMVLKAMLGPQRVFVCVVGWQVDSSLLTLRG